MIYTIGYSEYELSEFIETLKSYKIKILYDVRSKPFSSSFKEYNKNSISKYLSKNGISYKFLGDKLGGKPQVESLYSNNIIDYSKQALTDSFKTGINEIIKHNDSNICLMCAEEMAINCHRSLLIGRTLSELGLSILHIEKDIPLLSQRDIEIKLKNLYFPDNDQISLFDENNSYEFQINESYKMQNRKIGAKYCENEEN